jgi:hypothetical protein
MTKGLDEYYSLQNYIVRSNSVANQPETIATSISELWVSAIHRWMTPSIKGYPSSHAIINRIWMPSSMEITAGMKPGFGSTIVALTDNEECGIYWNKITKGATRSKLFKQIMTILSPKKDLRLSDEADHCNLVSKTKLAYKPMFWTFKSGD